MKRIGTFIILLCYLLLFGSCGLPQEGPPKREVPDAAEETLTIFYEKESPISYLEAIKQVGEDYSLEFVSYETENLMMEILVGNGPDIYPPECQDVHVFDLESWSVMGAFANLVPLLKASSFDFDLLHPAYAEQFQNKDEVCFLPLNASIPYLVTTKERCGGLFLETDQPRQDFSEFWDTLLAFRENSVQPDEIFMDFALSFPTFCLWSGYTPVDFETRTAQIDTPEFRKLVEYYQRIMSQGVRKIAELDYENDTQPAYVCLTEYMSASSCYAERMTELGEEPLILSLPSLPGREQNLTYRYGYAINANSSPEKQAIAAEFLARVYEIFAGTGKKFTTSLAYMNSVYCFTPEWILKQNNYLEKHVPSSPVHFASDQITSLTNIYRDISGVEYYNIYVHSGLIEVGMWEYFNGEKSLDECVMRLQNQLNLYLNE